MLLDSFGARGDSKGATMTAITATAITATEPLFTEAEWDFGTLDRVFHAIEEIALGELKLDVYPNQIENDFVESDARRLFPRSACL